jgi:hypothetical protein
LQYFRNKIAGFIFSYLTGLAVNRCGIQETGMQGIDHLLYMYHHTAICVSSYCYTCVLILLYVCPHTAMYMSSYCYVRVLILLYMCPRTAILVSSYSYICVLILLYVCPHTAMYMSAYCYVRVLILLYMCSHTAICVSSMCALTGMQGLDDSMSDLNLNLYAASLNLLG